MNNDSIVTPQDISKEPCRGIFFRGKVNYFISKYGEYVRSERMVPIKKMSCPGCPRCWFIKEDADERICQDVLNLPDDIEHGAIYEMRATNESRDFETGIIDSWDIEFTLCSTPEP